MSSAGLDNRAGDGLAGGRWGRPTTACTRRRPRLLCGRGCSFAGCAAAAGDAERWAARFSSSRRRRIQMMPVNLAGLRWWRIVAAAVAAFLVSMLVTFLIVTGYAFTLGVKARGAPDPKKISTFAHQVGPTWGPVVLAVFTAVGALWVARRVTDSVRHGVLVGAIAATAGLVPAWPPNLRDAAIFGVVVGAGCVGGFVGRRARLVSGSSAGSGAA